VALKHISLEEGIDFVNSVATSDRQVEIQKHLDSGCKRCADMIATWQKIHEAAASEPDYQPPAGVVRIAKAAFAASGVEKTSGGLELLFDSLMQPALAGTRSAASDTRQLLYASGPYLVDLYISQIPQRRIITLTGQLMNSKFPEKLLSEVPVVVTDRKEKTVLVKTNTFGEFRVEIRNSGDLELRLPDPIGRDIVISLGCLLTGLAGGDETSGTRGGN
jgi:hypothetical protein